ncbi:MAG: gp53-like domain-containing protein, partial [Paraclostridium sp.]
NYNNDFINGVEIGGKLTNNGKDVLAIINMMKQESGYLHLTNGMILQWGRLSSAIANGDTVQATVGFPVSFPTKCCSVSTTILGVDGQGDLGARYNGALKIMNNSYGVFFARNVTPEKWGSSMEISYIAIGY